MAIFDSQIKPRSGFGRVGRPPRLETANEHVDKKWQEEHQPGVRPASTKPRTLAPRRTWDRTRATRWGRGRLGVFPTHKPFTYRQIALFLPRKLSSIEV